MENTHKEGLMRIINTSVLSTLFIVLSVSTFQQVHAGASGSNLPNAKAGQCFAKVKVPEKYKTQTQKILLSKAITKRVLVKPAQYRWVDKRVKVQRGRHQDKHQPAQYKTTTKRVMVKPATEIWKKGRDAITRIDNMTGQIMCRVKVPAVYKNVEKKTLIQAAKTVQKYIPAVYKTVKKKVRISPEQYRTVQTPARYKTRSHRVKVSGPRYIWRPILCATNSNRAAVVKTSFNKAASKVIRLKKVKTKARIMISKERVEEIQKALKEKGFDPGEIDGQMGLGTVTALSDFQKSRGLPAGKITKDTSRALGLIR